MNLLQSSEGGKGQGMSCLLATARSKRKLMAFTSAVSLGKAVTKVLVLELVLLQSP